MKEMLFIMVAILIPPTLTYLGIVGDTHAQHPGLRWQQEVAMQPALGARTGEEQCWRE